MISKKIIVFVTTLSSSLLQQNIYADFNLFEKFGEGLKQSLTGQSQQPQAPVKTQPQQIIPTGSVSKTVNVRSGPGTSHGKVGSVNQTSIIRIKHIENNWAQVEADTSNGQVQGWIYKPLLTINGTVSVPGSATNSATASQSSAGTQNVSYAGYSKDFQTVKNMMSSGNLKGIDKFFTDREAEVLKKNQTKWQAMEEIGLLRWMERGTLYLDEGNIDKSVRAFTNAEDILNVRQEDSKISDFFTSITSFAAETVSGNEEFMEYPGVGYEKVLMLNYKSISFLLDGQRKAYNVSRRAIDWQNMEKAKFRDEIEAIEKETKEQKESLKTQSTDDEWKKKYKALDKIANKVPSAFVNPFGYYVTGMIQEFESKKDPSLKDNARIAYEKALDLNPNSSVLKQAVKDMKNKKKYGSKRLLHLVVGDGFAPEKKMLTYNIPTDNGGVIPIKLPIYEPVASKVARIELHTTGGKRLARLSSVADIEAISLRHQKDSEAFRSLKMILATIRATGVTAVTSQFGSLGNELGASLNDTAAPDMRSWMSLPANLQAARLYVSKNISKFKIVSFDSKGRRLASKTISLNSKSDSFIYARSVDKQLYVHSSKSLWTASN
ncbi:MAG: SH3 domain-containing protein [Gammaproteobacteria bacterium]|nr:SH3 domain-containing protein [Gammaproteobacteria bacterium]